MTLHHIYGFPYLPASGIKGVLRSWIIQNVFGNPENITEEGDKKSPLVNAEFRALTESKAFCKIFGCPAQVSKIELDENGERIKDKKPKPYDVALKNEKGQGQEHQGKITFFDAFPTAPPKIEVDVMTPHYGDYYTDNENKKGIAPTDTMSPNPIPFLTVADTPFQFLFGSKDFDIKQELWELKINEETKKGTLFDWLKSALENHGIGAKTAVGYGYMS
jgi:CRISPR-associated protein Cmr6